MSRRRASSRFATPLEDERNKKLGKKPLRVDVVFVPVSQEFWAQVLPDIRLYPELAVRTGGETEPRRGDRR